MFYNLFIQNMTKTKETKNELINQHAQMIEFVKNTVDKVENDLKRLKIILDKLSHFDPENADCFNDEKIAEMLGSKESKAYTDEDMEVVEGLFDGYFMVWPEQKKYPVPVNYSSKTKLIPGDMLKLKIDQEGKFIYKLIKPADRKHVKATLSKTDDGKFIAISDDNQTYFLNQAAVSFFKGRPGDGLYIIINAKEEEGFAAIEAVIRTSE